MSRLHFAVTAQYLSLFTLIFFGGCAHVETQRSRHYLNCRYHATYDAMRDSERGAALRACEALR